MTPIKPVDPRAPNWAENAQYLRELADRVESGAVTELVIVYNDRERTCYASYGFYGDRWRMLGALEYAKLTME